MAVRTENRTVGAKIANAITVQHPWGLPEGSVSIRLTGSAGQSFGAFIVDGMRLELEGEANDYVGKGMTGGEIAIRPPAVAPFDTPQAIAGNTILYGATGGSLFAAGRVGERFCVRNSGATAVVEGIGDHGCEYMTGGLVAVLGPTGYNFGAGMTNGAAFVYDPEGEFPGKINGESVLLEPVPGDVDAEELRASWSGIWRDGKRACPPPARRMAQHPPVLLESHPPRLDRRSCRGRSRGGTGTVTRRRRLIPDRTRIRQNDRRATHVARRSSFVPGKRRGNQALQPLQRQSRRPAAESAGARVRTITSCSKVAASGFGSRSTRALARATPKIRPPLFRRR